MDCTIATRFKQVFVHKSARISSSNLQRESPWMKAIKGKCQHSSHNSCLTHARPHRRSFHLVSLCYSYRNLFPHHEQSPCSDSAVKQILLTMNDKDNFIIEDLDDHHLVIKADEEYRVRKELEAEVRSFLSNIFSWCILKYVLVGKEHVQPRGVKATLTTSSW